MIRNRTSPCKALISVGKCDDDEYDEELKRLVEKERDASVTEESDSSASDNIPQYHNTGLSVNVRYLGILVFVFLAISQLLLGRQCVIASTKQRKAKHPLIRRWLVATENTPLSILSTPRESGAVMKMVQPGTIVETIGEGYPYYHRIIKPASGFIIRVGKLSGKDMLKPIDYLPDHDTFCPLLYEGWYWANYLPKTFKYAPMPLVIAQQLWNACQVFALFLLIALNYECTTSELTDEDLQTKRKWGVRLLSLMGLCILPFSGVMISVGAHMFALVTLGLTLVAILTPVSVLRISIGEYDSDSFVGGESWTLTREETIACLCNLGSSLYNYAGSIKTWPHWKQHFQNFDRYMGWPRRGDVTIDENFTLGLSNIRLPLFVARATGGSTTGAEQFAIVWSILPFLYVTYFLCMYVLAPKSPGKNIQRAFCLFGMCHFLFGTDMVAYRYGRGFHTPNGELFHWFEKFAWRTAMLLPIYQNCTNGHWEHGHRRYPMAGKVLRWTLIVWSVLFFIFQIIQSDIVKFRQFMHDKTQVGLITKWGLEEAPFFRSVLYPYREALVTMIIMYATLHFTGFTLFRIFVRREGSVHGIRNKGSFDSDDAELQLRLVGSSDDDDSYGDDVDENNDQTIVFRRRLSS